MNRIIKIAAAAAVLGFAGVASAASAQEDIMIVRVGDLNTKGHEGAATALRRIKTAANAFCGPQNRDLGANHARQLCVQKMTGKAVASLNAPMVTALYNPGESFTLAQNETQSR